jgi:hypothetical protein
LIVTVGSLFSEKSTEAGEGEKGKKGVGVKAGREGI